MKAKIIYLVSVFASFLVGVLVTFLAMTKQQMDRALKLQPESSVEFNEVIAMNQEKSSCHDYDRAVVTEKSSETPIETINQMIEEPDNLSIKDFSQEQAIQLVDDMPNVILDQYVDKFMTSGASNVITDKRQFAKRAIEELYNPSVNQLLTGEVKLSLSSIMPEYSIDTSSINANEKIFAHLDTKFTEGETLLNGQYIFVKWVNTTTGQVLLFTKKDIQLGNNHNWVSFQPDETWEAGSYNVTFYEFSSQLRPIANINYDINNILDTKPMISETSSVVIKGS